MGQHPAIGKTSPSVGAKIGFAVLGILAVFAGVWVFASLLSGLFADLTGIARFITSLGFLTIWFGIVFLIAARTQLKKSPWRLPMWIAFAVPALITGFVFGYTHLVDKTVNDQLAVADAKASDIAAQTQPTEPADPGSEPDTPTPPKAMNIEILNGTFDGIGHHAVGDLKVIKLAEGGRRLTMSNVDIENAPDLHVYLAKDEVDGDVGDYEYLSSMKGNKGNQQYKIPDDLDLKTYDVVVVWCRAFDVGVAQAPLRES